MAERLISEVLNHAPRSLKVAERLAAVALAADADDDTRLTQTSPFAPRILGWADVEDAAEMRRILRKLMRIGVIEQVGTAYRFRQLRPAAPEGVSA